MGETAAVLTISDKGSRGEREDTSGPALCEMLAAAGYEVVCTAILPDEYDEIRDHLIRLSDSGTASLIVTTGGTGFSPRDVTPEATKAAIEREAPGLAEYMRMKSMEVTPHGALSRGVSGLRGGSLIVNLPGSRRAATENLSFILPSLKHGLEILHSAGSADCGENSPHR